MKRLPLLCIVLCLLATLAVPQGFNRYEQLYGTPVDVSLGDLIQSGLYYTNKAIRTHGRLERVGTGETGGEVWALRDNFNYKVRIVPVSELSGEFENEAHFRTGIELRITGVVHDTGAQPAAGFDNTVVIEFWKFDIPPDAHLERLSKAKGLSIGQLTGEVGRWDGATIRVAGEFRGRNLYGDLPSRTQRNRSDWVILENDHAVWVTGKKPKGLGWELDATMKRDTGKWIEVIGRPETRNGITYLRAEVLKLVPAPQLAAPSAESTPTLPPPPKAPPVVVFALPVDGETEVPGDSRFTVQFSKDMDEGTFKDHVLLRYLGPPRPGVRPLESVSIQYDPGRRALTVDPGDQLYRGAQIELLLLPGIKDVDGLELIPRRGAVAEGVVDALHFRIG